MTSVETPYEACPPASRHQHLVVSTYLSSRLFHYCLQFPSHSLTDARYNPITWKAARALQAAQPYHFPVLYPFPQCPRSSRLSPPCLPPLSARQRVPALCRPAQPLLAATSVSLRTDLIRIVLSEATRSSITRVKACHLFFKKCHEDTRLTHNSRICLHCQPRKGQLHRQICPLQ